MQPMRMGAGMRIIAAIAMRTAHSSRIARWRKWIDFCVKIGQDMGMYPDSEQARGQMLAWFPTLKRWESGGQA